ncbi:hypothetical protein LIA77_00480 [Sarocladium implicatum]|nr:hypothetical protein LIA77_00480 [Sarocladium implicatum]
MSAPSSPISQTAPGLRRQQRDTGFPEPFDNDRNTTLPYPGADLSPNARITMDDGLLNTDPFSHKRSFRRSRLGKHKRTVSYGRITPQYEAMQSVMSVIEATAGGASQHQSANTGDSSSGSVIESSAQQTSRVPATPVSASFSSVRSSREETESFASKRDDDTPPSSPESHSSRKSGFLHRLRRLSRG